MINKSYLELLEDLIKVYNWPPALKSLESTHTLELIKENVNTVYIKSKDGLIIFKITADNHEQAAKYILSKIAISSFTFVRNIISDIQHTKEYDRK